MEFKRTKAIKTEKIPDEQSSKIPSSHTLNPNSETKKMMSVMTVAYQEAKGKIYVVTNKYELENQEEIDEHTKACQERMSKFNASKTKDNFNEDLAMKLFKWEERNMIELLLPKKGGDSIYIFNPLSNKIEQIFIEDAEPFPIGFSLCIKLPYCFCSGGKIKNEEDEYEELNTFYSLRRKGDLSFEKIELPPMSEAKSNHCLVEIPYMKGICALGGVDSNGVELFKLGDKKWEEMPALNEAREGAACCVVNDTFLYCFFGYNNQKCEYYTSIEKLDLEENEEWKLLNPFGNKTFMKRKFSACIEYRENFEEKIYILGGINVLKSESMDCLVYNQINDTIEKTKFTLPYKSSFICNSFTLLPNGLYTNLSSDFQVIQYQPMGQILFGLRKK